MIVENGRNIIIMLDKVKILGHVAAWGADYNDCYAHTLSINHKNPEQICNMLELCTMPSKVKCIVYNIVGGEGVTRCLTGIIDHCDPWKIRVRLANDKACNIYKLSETDLSWLTEGI